MTVPAPDALSDTRLIRNYAPLEQALLRIAAVPQLWNQLDYRSDSLLSEEEQAKLHSALGEPISCGTAHCVAGWIAEMTPSAEWSGISRDSAMYRLPGETGYVHARQVANAELLSVTFVPDGAGGLTRRPAPVWGRDLGLQKAEDVLYMLFFESDLSFPALLTNYLYAAEKDEHTDIPVELVRVLDMHGLHLAQGPGKPVSAQVWENGDPEDTARFDDDPGPCECHHNLGL